MIGKDSLKNRVLKASLSQSMIFCWKIALHTTSHLALHISGSRWEALSSLRKSHSQKFYCAYMMLRWLGDPKVTIHSMRWSPPVRVQFRHRCRVRLGFPGVLVVKESTCQCRRHKRCGFDPWVGKIPRRRAWQPSPVILAWKIPRTEEPGRLQYIGSQRVGHDWTVLAHTRREWLAT